MEHFNVTRTMDVFIGSKTCTMGLTLMMAGLLTVLTAIAKIMEPWATVNAASLDSSVINVPIINMNVTMLRQYTRQRLMTKSKVFKTILAR